MQTHALVNIYNDHVLLPIMLASLKGGIDTIIVADGAYKLYLDFYKKADKNAKPWSTDGTLQLLEVIPNLPPIKLIECIDGKPWINQCVKRTALLDAVPEGDWFIIIDSDEMLYGNVEEGLKEIKESGCIVGYTPLYNAGLDVSHVRPFWHPRVFKKEHGMHYFRKHWLLRDFAGRVVEASYPKKWTDTFVFAHLKAFRERGRLTPHLSYMQMMSKSGWMEAAERHRHFNIPKA